MAVTAGLMLLAGEATAQSLFKTLDGAWTGAGNVLLDGGKSERLQCRAYYNHRGTGETLGLSIRCASTSYKIELRASLTSSGGNISGKWEERTFNADGTVSGKASGNTLNLTFHGNVDGTMAVNVGERQHRVTITVPNGGLRGVTINLARG